MALGGNRSFELHFTQYQMAEEVIAMDSSYVFTNFDFMVASSILILSLVGGGLIMGAIVGILEQFTDRDIDG